MKKFSILFVTVAGLMFGAGCSHVYMPSVDPNKSDMSPEQTTILTKTKLKVPCRVEVHCPDNLTGSDPGFFSDDSFHYPLQEIIRNSFNSATQKTFEAPRSEVIDAFTVNVTVPESSLEVDGETARYSLHVVVLFKEPGEKKIEAFELKKQLEMPFENKKEVAPVIYRMCQEIAFEATKKLSESPKVKKTIKRFEER
jgi:hypothetical protein